MGESASGHVAPGHVDGHQAMSGAHARSDLDLEGPECCSLSESEVADVAMCFLDVVEHRGSQL